MDEISDLIDHFKLDARFSDDVTSQASFTPNAERGSRRVKVERKWHRGKSLGHGAFGAVWLEEERDGEEIRATRAVKEISKPYMKSVQIDYQRELLALGSLSKYPNEFVEFYGWFDNDRTVFMVMEYLPLGDLEQYIEAGITEQESKLIASQLLEGLALMHKLHFAHRDLKPSNIFVVSPSPRWWVKIGDFGITKRVASSHTALRTELGTRSFQAPEVAGITGDCTEYSNAVDMWSFGCVLYKMLTNISPFKGQAALATFCSGGTSFPIKTLVDKLVSSEGIDFLQVLLSVDPLARPPASGGLSHPWIISLEQLPTESVGRIASVTPTDERSPAHPLVTPNNGLKVTIPDVPPDPKVSGSAVADSDYIRTDEFGVSVIEGHEPLVISRHDSDSILVQENYIGQTGLVPEAYVRLDPDSRDERMGGFKPWKSQEISSNGSRPSVVLLFDHLDPVPIRSRSPRRGYMLFDHLDPVPIRSRSPRRGFRGRFRSPNDKFRRARTMISPRNRKWRRLG